MLEFEVEVSSPWRSDSIDNAPFPELTTNVLHLSVFHSQVIFDLIPMQILFLKNVTETNKKHHVEHSERIIQTMFICIHMPLFPDSPGLISTNIQI